MDFTTLMGQRRTNYHTDFNVNEWGKMCVADVRKIKTNKRISYFNCPASFDIETTSFYDENRQKCAIMYEWSFGLNGAVVVGRTWDEWLEFYGRLVKCLGTFDDSRIIVYIHNEAFEFQFMRTRHTWKNVFALDERKPVYALTTEGVEFRCSYTLSGYSLEKLGGQLKKYNVEKAVGDLDYSLIRHSETPLSEREWGYCVTDVRVVMAYIQEQIEHCGDITKIPLTKTGFVRKYCRDACLYEGSHKKSVDKYSRYRDLMKHLTLTPDEYRQAKRAFQGGFTHANAFYARKTLYNVGSYDFTSSYPAVMVAECFPMSKGELIKIKNEKHFSEQLRLYCCMFDVEFEGLESVVLFEHPLSRSRCSEVVGAQEDNGRIVCAEHLITTLTEQDYSVIQKFYKWRKMRIANFRRYKRGYLPTDFIKAILKLYADKTTLKNVVGKETEYGLAKEMINSAYGMCVTDICRDEIAYSDSWTKNCPDIDKSIEKYNTSKKRFLSYLWGVWVTAYARKNLFTGIWELKADYVYADTDSVKGLNMERHRAYFEWYDRNINKKLELACKHHGIDLALTRPKTIEGTEKPLGFWDNEGVYTRFKTLGAKRYMSEKDGKISITVSGVNKKFAVPYLLEKYGDGVFDAFDDDLKIPAEHTGKMTHTYIDEPIRGILIDYMGNSANYGELSGVHLENAEYSLSMSDAYLDFIMGVREFTK